MTKNSTPPASIRRRTSPSHPGTTWTSSRYTVTPSAPSRCGNRRTCSSSSQPRSATVSPASRSSSSNSSNWDSGRAPAARRAARCCARNDVLPLRRTPITANALPGMAGSRTSRRVRCRGGLASDSLSLARRISRDTVTTRVTISRNWSLRKGQLTDNRHPSLPRSPVRRQRQRLEVDAARAVAEAVGRHPRLVEQAQEQVGNRPTASPAQVPRVLTNIGVDNRSFHHSLARSADHGGSQSDYVL